MCWIDDDHNDHHGDGDDKDDHHGDDKDDDDKMWRPLDCLDPTTVSGSRRIGDDHNDQDYDDEDGDNVDLHDNEAGLTSYPHRLSESQCTWYQLYLHVMPLNWNQAC